MPASEADEPAAAAASSRRSPRRRWTTTAWRAVSVVAVLGLFLLLVGEVTRVSDVAADHTHHGGAAAGSGVLDELQTLVATDGLEPALARLRARASAERTVLRDAHHHVHELGRSAQARYGTAEAFGRCDASFHSGCYHGVVEAHFDDLPAVDRSALPSFCRGGVIDAPGHLEGDCVHGLGHGLQTFFGDDLRSALDHCDALSGTVPSGVDARQLCYGGAFMERVDNPPPPVDLCVGLDERFLTLCHFHLARAAFRANGRDLPATFAECDRVDPRYTVACYEGMGRVAGSVATFDPAQTQQLCRQGAVPYQPYCIRGAAQFLVGMFGTTDQAIQLCTQAPVGTRTGCFELVGLSTVKLHADLAGRAAECAKSAPEWAPVCRRAAGLAAELDGSP